MSIEAIKLAAEFNRYFTSANGVDVPAKVSVSRDEWRALFTAIQQAEAKQPAAGESGEPVACQGCGDDATHEAGSDETSFPGAYCDNCGPRAAATTPVLEPAQATQAASAEDMKVYDSIADRYFREATQAEVTDEQIREAATKAVKAGKLSWVWFEKDDQDKYTIPSLSKSHYQFARAILALRPERVPMTEDQVWHNDALMSANGTAGFKMDALMRIVRAVESHHG